MVHLGSGAVTVKTKVGSLRVDCRMAGVPPARLAPQLEAYLAGKPVRFKYRLNLSSGTPFQQKVWRAMLAIPRGETRSYAWLAKKIGKPKAVRASAPRVARTRSRSSCLVTVSSPATVHSADLAAVSR